MLSGLACRLPRILGVILTDKDGVTVAKCTFSVDDMILRVRYQSFTYSTRCTTHFAVSNASKFCAAGTDAELSETKLERSYFAQVSNDMEKVCYLPAPA